MSEDALFEEKKNLVLERFKTLNPEAKIMLGNEKELKVKDIIKQVELGNEFGRKIVDVQINMLKILAGA